MMTFKVHGHKFHDIDKLNSQIIKVMRRYGCLFGYFEVGEEYEVNGTVNLIIE